MALDVRVKDWTQRDRQTNLTLAFGLWNGRISIQVYDSKNIGSKMFRRNLSDDELVLIEKMINKISAGSPDTKCSCQFQKYDPQSKQFRIESVVSFEKDSKMCYKMAVTDATKQQTYTFTLRASATMTMGNEPLQDANLSSIKLETLKGWITTAKIWAPATVQPMDKFGNRGGGRPSGGAAPMNSRPADTTTMSPNDPDQLPF